MPSEARPCPSPTKKAFGSRRQAERALGLSWRKHRDGGKLPTRTYRCRCGQWHLTSMTRSGGGA